MFSRKFCQKVVIVANFVFAVWVTLSYVLAWKGMDTNSTVTTAVVTQCIATNWGYFLYQGALKNSRNKYGVDEKGIPFEMKEGKIHEYGRQTTAL